MSFQQARQNLSIIQVAEKLGYAYNKAKGQNKPQFEHPNGDKIIVSFPNDSSIQTYFNRDGSDDRGSVIDFIKNRLNQFSGLSYQKDMDGVNQVLKQFNAIATVVTAPTVSTIFKPTEKKTFNLDDFQVKKFESPHYAYFISRGLTAQTLEKFKSHISIVKENEQQFYNIGFPYKNDSNETVGFELRNQNFKGHALNSDKEAGVWIANFAPVAGLTRQVFLFESSLDALSFYQIYNNKYDFSTAAFVSFGGGVAPKQVDTVVNTFPQAKYFSGFDNDVNGHVYDYVIEKRLNPKLDLEVKRVGEELVVKNKNTELKLSLVDFSLKKIAELTGKKLHLYITKPKQGKDYNEMLVALKEMKTEKKPERFYRQ